MSLHTARNNDEKSSIHLLIDSISVYTAVFPVTVCFPILIFAPTRFHSELDVDFVDRSFQYSIADAECVLCANKHFSRSSDAAH